MEPIEPKEIKVGDRCYVPERDSSEDIIILTAQEIERLMKTSPDFIKNMKFLAVREITPF